MRFVSLFAGIGGFDLGLERAGMQCVGQVEINPFCQRVLAHHWPNVKRIEDIKNVAGNEFGEVELVCGGPPCQPASSAGKRKGAGDDRWLWSEALRVGFAILPAWLLFENPYGILTLENGLEFQNILFEMGDKGYSVQAFIIPVAALDAPHRRDRVWILAHLDKGIRSPEPWEQQKERAALVHGSTSIYADNNEMRRTAGSGAAGKEKGSISKGSDAKRCDWWEAEPTMGRMVRRFSRKLDQCRIEALGNSANPQVVEVIGRAIMATERAASMPQENGPKK
jgi:DNA (cytosine-5)-methyltransferase 1